MDTGMMMFLTLVKNVLISVIPVKKLLIPVLIVLKIVLMIIVSVQMVHTMYMKPNVQIVDIDVILVLTKKIIVSLVEVLKESTHHPVIVVLVISIKE